MEATRRKLIRSALVAALALWAPLSAGCGMLMQGDEATLHISCNVPSAKITANGDKMPIGTVKVPRKYEILFHAEAPGYKPVDVRCAKVLQVRYAVGDILLLWPGIIIDWITGDWCTLEPNEVALDMEKDPAPSIPPASDPGYPPPPPPARK